jgi:hypothetical protein
MDEQINQTKPSQAKPNWTEPNWTEPNLTKPNQTKEWLCFIFYAKQALYVSSYISVSALSIKNRQGPQIYFCIATELSETILCKFPYFPLDNARVIYRKIFQCIPRMLIFFFTNFDRIYIDNARVIYRKIR